MCESGITCNTLLHSWTIRSRPRLNHCRNMLSLVACIQKTSQFLCPGSDKRVLSKDSADCRKTRVHLHQISLFTFASLSLSLLVCTGLQKALCLVGRGWVRGEQVTSLSHRETLTLTPTTTLELPVCNIALKMEGLIEY